MESFLNLDAVTDDLVRYMNATMTPSNQFLIDDPVWAVDFAPNGKSEFHIRILG